MKFIIILFGALFILIGITLLVSPDFIFDWLEDSLQKGSLYMTAIVFRLFMGIALVMAAKESKFPGVIKFIGYLAIFAAIVFIFIGRTSFYDFFSSLIADFKPYAPVSALIGIAVGGFLIYAFLDNKESKQQIG
ncbi:MAG: hypothetical protein HKN67_13540 [Saprospiraceae bacterium]|nr:hypothetical protein [Saprospiraceae bacterium]